MCNQIHVNSIFVISTFSSCLISIVLVFSSSGSLNLSMPPWWTYWNVTKGNINLQFLVIVLHFKESIKYPSQLCKDPLVLADPRKGPLAILSGYLPWPWEQEREGRGGWEMQYPREWAGRGKCQGKGRIWGLQISYISVMHGMFSQAFN